MRKITTFNFTTLDGYFKGPGGDISWHRHGAEEGEYAAESLQSDNMLLFGRITYEMMSGYWPTPMAMEHDPVVASEMNEAEKIVFSNTLTLAHWNNTTILSGDIIEKIKEIKRSPGKNMTLLGSGTILTQLAEAGLIDEYQVMIDPVVLGEGTPLFKNIGHQLELKLTETRAFSSGVVLLRYEPMNPAN